MGSWSHRRICCCPFVLRSNLIPWYPVHFSIIQWWNCHGEHKFIQHRTRATIQRSLVPKYCKDLTQVHPSNRSYACDFQRFEESIAPTHGEWASMFSGNSAQERAECTIWHVPSTILILQLCVGHSIQLLNFTGQTIVKRLIPTPWLDKQDRTLSQSSDTNREEIKTSLIFPDQKYVTLNIQDPSHNTQDHTNSLDPFSKVPDPIPGAVKKYPY